MSTLINTSRLLFHHKKSDEIKISCSCCGYLLRDKEDFESYKTTEACTTCADTYYYPNAEAWKAGWRPKLEKENDY